MQTFTIDRITFEYYEKPVYGEARGQLWATCRTCRIHEKIAQAVQNAAEAHTIADDYVHGPYRHDCSPSHGRTPPPPGAGREGLVWLIKGLLDLGPLHRYRYRIEGEIWDRGRFVDEFTWHVSRLDDPAYCVPPGKEFDAVRVAVEEARREAYRD